MNEGTPLPPNTPLPVDLLIKEVTRVFRDCYIREAWHHAPSVESIRRDPEWDVDFSPEEDRLYLWYQDPQLNTPDGRCFEGAFLTPHPDTFDHFSRRPPGEILNWVKERAARHAQSDLIISRFRDTALLKGKLHRTIRYGKEFRKLPGRDGKSTEGSWNEH